MRENARCKRGNCTFFGLRRLSHIRPVEIERKESTRAASVVPAVYRDMTLAAFGRRVAQVRPETFVGPSVGPETAIGANFARDPNDVRRTLQGCAKAVYRGSWAQRLARHHGPATSRCGGGRNEQNGENEMPHRLASLLNKVAA